MLGGQGLELGHGGQLLLALAMEPYPKRAKVIGSNDSRVQPFTGIVDVGEEPHLPCRMRFHCIVPIHFTSSTKKPAVGPFAYLPGRGLDFTQTSKISHKNVARQRDKVPANGRLYPDGGCLFVLQQF